MIDALSFWGSFAAGLALMFMSIFGVMAFVKRLSWGQAATRVLAWAVLLGFFAAMANTIYWQVVGQFLLSRGLIDVGQLRLIGGFADLFFKGGAAASIYLHLVALRLSLPDDERDQWTALGMAFYPKRLWGRYRK